MTKTNKYGYIHGGESFFKLDTEAHDLAVEKIGECMTSNASIYYHKPLLKEESDNYKIEFKIISQTRSSVLIQGQILKENEECVTGMFTFLKIKK